MLLALVGGLEGWRYVFRLLIFSRLLAWRRASWRFSGVRPDLLLASRRNRFASAVRCAAVKRGRGENVVAESIVYLLFLIVGRRSSSLKFNLVRLHLVTGRSSTYPA